MRHRVPRASTLGPLVEGVETGHLRGRERKVVDVGILDDPRRRVRLGQRDCRASSAEVFRNYEERTVSLLQTPADENLRGRLSRLARDRLEHGIVESRPTHERTVRLDHYPVRLAVGHDPTLLVERVQLDLIHLWCRHARCDEFLKVHLTLRHSNSVQCRVKSRRAAVGETNKVGDAQREELALLLLLLEHPPRLEPAHGPRRCVVQQKQVLRR